MSLHSVCSWISKKWLAHKGAHRMTRLLCDLPSWSTWGPWKANTFAGKCSRPSLSSLFKSWVEDWGWDLQAPNANLFTFHITVITVSFFSHVTVVFCAAGLWSHLILFNCGNGNPEKLTRSRIFNFHSLPLAVRKNFGPSSSLYWKVGCLVRLQQSSRLTLIVCSSHIFAFRRFDLSPLQSLNHLSIPLTLIPIMSTTSYVDSEYADEEKTFLDKSGQSSSHPLNKTHYSKSRRLSRSEWTKFLIVQLALICAYTTIFFALREGALIYCKIDISP